MLKYLIFLYLQCTYSASNVYHQHTPVHADFISFFKSYFDFSNTKSNLGDGSVLALIDGQYSPCAIIVPNPMQNLGNGDSNAFFDWPEIEKFSIHICGNNFRFIAHPHLYIDEKFTDLNTGNFITRRREHKHIGFKNFKPLFDYQQFYFDNPHNYEISLNCDLNFLHHPLIRDISNRLSTHFTFEDTLNSGFIFERHFFTQDLIVVFVNGSIYIISGSNFHELVLLNFKLKPCVQQQFVYPNPILPFDHGNVPNTYVQNEGYVYTIDHCSNFQNPLLNQVQPPILDQQPSSFPSMPQPVYLLQPQQQLSSSTQTIDHQMSNYQVGLQLPNSDQQFSFILQPPFHPSESSGLHPTGILQTSNSFQPYLSQQPMTILQPSTNLQLIINSQYLPINPQVETGPHPFNIQQQPIAHQSPYGIQQPFPPQQPVYPQAQMASQTVYGLQQPVIISQTSADQQYSLVQPINQQLQQNTQHTSVPQINQQMNIYDQSSVQTPIAQTTEPQSSSSEASGFQSLNPSAVVSNPDAKTEPQTSANISQPKETDSKSSVNTQPLVVRPKTVKSASKTAEKDPQPLETESKKPTAASKSSRVNRHSQSKKSNYRQKRPPRFSKMREPRKESELTVQSQPVADNSKVFEPEKVSSSGSELTGTTETSVQSQSEVEKSEVVEPEEILTDISGLKSISDTPAQSSGQNQPGLSVNLQSEQEILCPDNNENIPVVVLEMKIHEEINSEEHQSEKNKETSVVSTDNVPHSAETTQLTTSSIQKDSEGSSVIQESNEITESSQTENKVFSEEEKKVMFKIEVELKGLLGLKVEPAVNYNDDGSDLKLLELNAVSTPKFEDKKEEQEVTTEVEQSKSKHNESKVDKETKENKE